MKILLNTVVFSAYLINRFFSFFSFSFFLLASPYISSYKVATINCLHTLCNKLLIKKERYRTSFNNASISKYRQSFFANELIACLYSNSPIETRFHLLYDCE